MKKIIQISEGNNTITLKQRDGEQYTFVKIYDSKKKLIRHSRSSGSTFQFTATPGKYILETDGNLELSEERNKDTSQNLKKIYKYLEVDLRNNMLTLKGIPFYQTENLGTFVNRMVKDKKELKGYFEAQLEREAKKAEKKVLSDKQIVEVLSGVSTVAERAKIKRKVQDFNREKKRISIALKKAKNATEMFKIIPRFSNRF